MAANPTWGVNLAAAPDTIILDPNDLSAPRDPVTQKLIGKTTISALLLDATLDSVAGANITFSATAGKLASNGVSVVTDAGGFAKEPSRCRKTARRKSP